MSPGERKYPRLFEPFRLGPLELPNRIVMPALTTNFAEPDGSVGDSLCTYLAARARGGFGHITTENIGVRPSGRVMPRMVMGDDDRFIQGLARLARAVKDEGCAVFGQISHAGRQTKSAMTGTELVAPSPIPCPLNREMPHVLTIDEVGEMERAFIAAARRLAEAGYDGVEIHGAHDYLVAEFLSRYANAREDEYGGSLDNRMRFLVNIIDGIRTEIGPDFPIVVRLSAKEFVEDGIDVPEAIAIATRLKEKGVVAISVSAGVYESFNKVSMVTGEPEGQLLGLAGEVRAGAGLPVIGVGRIKRPEVAEEGLARGQIDLAAFGRASIADPGLPNKVRRGETSRIVWCHGCNVCLGRSGRPETICSVNPAVGREAEFRFERTAAPRRIAVAGGGPAALTAAWIAAAQGHEVELFASSAELGGMQGWRARVPGQEEHAEIVEAAAARARAAGAAFADGPLEAGGHELVWSVRRFLPERANGLEAAAPVVSSYDVLAAGMRLPDPCEAVVWGDDLSAAEAAVVLAEAGYRVALYSERRDIAMDAHPGFREVSRRALAARGAEVAAGVQGGPPEAALAAAGLVVLGRDPAIDYDDADGWRAPALGLAADALIDDAYEPGRMTRGVYGAARLALDLRIAR